MKALSTLLLFLIASNAAIWELLRRRYLSGFGAPDL
jgi:hypothetical protein